MEGWRVSTAHLFRRHRRQQRIMNRTTVIIIARVIYGNNGGGVPYTYLRGSTGGGRLPDLLFPVRARARGGVGPRDAPVLACVRASGDRRAGGVNRPVRGGWSLVRCARDVSRSIWSSIFFFYLFGGTINLPVIVDEFPWCVIPTWTDNDPSTRTITISATILL